MLQKKVLEEGERRITLELEGVQRIFGVMEQPFYEVGRWRVLEVEVKLLQCVWQGITGGRREGRCLATDGQRRDGGHHPQKPR